MGSSLPINLFENYTILENNVTKALITLLNYSETFILRRFLKKCGINEKNIGKSNIEFKVQKNPNNEKTEIKREKRKRKTVPDAWINSISNDFIICLEVKIYDGKLYEEQLIGHIEKLSKFHKKRKYLLTITKDDNNSKAIYSNKVKSVARKYKVKIKNITWLNEITNFLMKQSTKIKSQEKMGYFLVNQLIDYLGGIGMLNIKGFEDIDFDAIDEERHKDRNERIELIRKNVAPKLINLKEALETHFRNAGLEKIRGHISKYYYVGKALGAFINFSEEKKDKQYTVHYSLGIHKIKLNPPFVYFKIHLAAQGKNFENFIKEITQKGTDEFFRILDEISKQTKNYRLCINSLDYDQLGNYWEIPIKPELDKEYINALIKIFEKGNCEFLEIERRFYWERNRINDKKIISDGNKLCDELDPDIKILKPLYDYLYKLK